MLSYPFDIQIDVATGYLTNGDLTLDQKHIVNRRPMPADKRRWIYRDARTQKPIPPHGEPGCPVDLTDFLYQSQC